MADTIKGIFGCGVVCAFATSALGGDTAMQWAFFAFGCTYGGLWIKSDQPSLSAGERDP